ncbi:MAG: hypothetical protein UT63_C0058G0006 [Candidatus Gottesmanbacteria bacterium GW2011_GWC2_39_8]|uniref:Uncharacterized protein n=1 Tax=Candidatus Gottesmanbacteria bacterium GW2011_GWC2_39_8 TaxID=1618450 RepID=A0A0G0SAT8_9BACT|nr:MAG: hypothetical protein UT63_C0058G0006 [Candidatus Gottesmanbacteria bacterium GW2011_GWC2_39_8]
MLFLCAEDLSQLQGDRKSEKVYDGARENHAKNAQWYLQQASEATLRIC